MLAYVVKVALTSVLVVAISEVSKRSTLLGALLASLPLTSLLAIVWLWHDTRDAARVAELTSDIFWLVLPSLLFFVVLPSMLRGGFQFWPSLAAASAATVAAYLLALRVLASGSAAG